MAAHLLECSFKKLRLWSWTDVSLAQWLCCLLRDFRYISSFLPFPCLQNGDGNRPPYRLVLRIEQRKSLTAELVCAVTNSIIIGTVLDNEAQ